MNVRRQLLTALLVAPLCAMAWHPDVLAQRRQARTTKHGGPSLQETLDWLRAKLPVFLSSHDDGVEFRPIRFEGCTISWKLKTLTSSGPSVDDISDILANRPPKPRAQRPKDSATVTVRLSDLDPSGVKVKYFAANRYTPPFWLLSLNGYNDKEAITSVEVPAGSNEGYTSKDSFVWLSFKYEDSAQRVARAFAHAIRLCGGRVEPF